MILNLDKVEAGYDTAQVLFGVNLSIDAGACVSLMGRNGMGKTTIVRTIMGQLPLTAGSITRFGDKRVSQHHFKLLRLESDWSPKADKFLPISALLKT